MREKFLDVLAKIIRVIGILGILSFLIFCLYCAWPIGDVIFGCAVLLSIIFGWAGDRIEKRGL